MFFRDGRSHRLTLSADSEAAHNTLEGSSPLEVAHTPGRNLVVVGRMHPLAGTRPQGKAEVLAGNSCAPKIIVSNTSLLTDLKRSVDDL